MTTPLSNDPIIAHAEGHKQGRADILDDIDHYDPAEHDMENPDCCDLCREYRAILYRLVTRWPHVYPWGMHG